MSDAMHGGDNMRRAAVCFPVVFLCLWGGFWVAHIIDPQGMSYGEPMADRVRDVFRLGSYPAKMLAITAAIAASLLSVDAVTPQNLRLAVLCMGALFAGALYFELFLGEHIETLFAFWPGPVGDVAALSSLAWPHMALVGTKLALSGARLPEPSAAKAKVGDDG